MADNYKPLYQPWNEDVFNADPIVQKMDMLPKFAYRALLQASFFCSTRPYLPAKDSQLWVLAGLDSEETWRKIRKNVLPMFEKTKIDGVLVLFRKRVLDDWQKLQEVREKNRQKANKRWEKENAVAMPQDAAAYHGNAETCKEVKISKEKLSEGKEREEMRRRTFEAICHRYGLAPDPKGYGSWGELAGICEGLGERAVESAFEEWASKHTHSTVKPITAFVKVAPTLANKMVVVEENPRLDEFCDYASDKSDMHIIFNKLQRTEVSDLLDKYQYSDLILAFEKFYGIIENDLYQLKFGAKDFVEKAPQILRTMQKRKAEAEAAEKQLAEIKSRTAEQASLERAQAASETFSTEDTVRDLLGE